MFIDCPIKHCLAPAERNVLVDEFVEPCVSLRWSEEILLTRGFYKHSVPPGLGDLVRDLTSPLSHCYIAMSSKCNLSPP